MNIEPTPLHGEDFFGAQAWEKLQKFASLLVEEGELRGLIGPRELEKLWTRHILNSTAIESFLSENSDITDVGSGAGFPGIVIAIIRPDVTVYLLETMERRILWLDYVKEKLNLSNVVLLHGRAEEFIGKHSTKYVTARAVAALKKLLPWTMPLVESNGKLLALKGGRAEQEIEEASSILRKYGAEWVDIHDVDVKASAEGTRVVEIKKS
ncbi:MAG: 16S rRNA (guanine(527)-N(7))-methyltransferase RsmG [Arcanobacterium sp.]|nr:16S rRNA (guanine(527)-N(7))-methyltransferase RsmG [Arcanobacterium sp.]